MKQEKSKVCDNQYINIQGWMRTKLGLTGNNLIVYAVVYGFSQDGESSFDGSRSYISDWLGCSLPTVDKSIDFLVENKLIFKETIEKNNIKFNKFKANLSILNNEQPYKDALYGIKSLYTINNVNNVNNDNNINNVNNVINHSNINNCIDNIIHRENQVSSQQTTSKNIEDDKSLFTKNQIKTKKEPKTYEGGMYSLFRDIDRLPDTSEVKQALKGWVETVYKKFPMSKAQFTVSYDYLRRNVQSDSDKVVIINYAIMSNFQNLQWAKEDIDKRKPKVDFMNPSKSESAIKAQEEGFKKFGENMHDISDIEF